QAEAGPGHGRETQDEQGARPGEAWCRREQPHEHPGDHPPGEAEPRPHDEAAQQGPHQTTGRQARRAPAAPVWWSVSIEWTTTERAPGRGTNGTDAAAVAAPSSTLMSSHISVSSLTSGGVIPASTSV